MHRLRRTTPLNRRQALAWRVATTWQRTRLAWGRFAAGLFAWSVITLILGLIDLGTGNRDLSLWTLGLSTILLIGSTVRLIRTENDPIAVYILAAACAFLAMRLCSPWGVAAGASAGDVARFQVLVTYFFWLTCLATAMVTWGACDAARRREPTQLALRLRR